MHIYKNNNKGNKRIINIWTQSLYYIYIASDVKYAQAHIKCFVLGCKIFCLKVEGRRKGEGME